MMSDHKILLEDSIDNDFIEEIIYNREKCMDASFHGINSIIIGGFILLIVAISFISIDVTDSRLDLKETQCTVINMSNDNKKINFIVRANITLEGVSEDDIFNLTVKIKDNHPLKKINQTYICYYGFDLKNNFVISWKQFHVKKLNIIVVQLLVGFFTLLGMGLLSFGFIYIILKCNQIEKYYINKKLKKNQDDNV